MDSTYRSPTLTRVARWLYINELRPDIGAAVLKVLALHQRRDSDGQLLMILHVQRPYADTLRSATTQPALFGGMSGPLDRAFEYALPHGEWPVFFFVIETARAA